MYGKTFEGEDGRYVDITLSIIFSQFIMCKILCLEQVLVVAFWLAKLIKKAGGIC